MEEKKISKMTDEEILRQQLELLAECSKSFNCDLAAVTHAMVEIYKALHEEKTYCGSTCRLSERVSS